MEVYAPVLRELQDLGAQDLPEGGDHDQVRLPRANQSGRGWLGKALGLDN
jgi:hypothetical protein